MSDAKRVDRRAVALVFLAVTIVFLLIPSWEHQSRFRLEIARGLGWSAAVVLLLSASCSPLAALWRRRTGRDMGLRRERRMFGLTTLGLGLLHLAFLLPSLSVPHLLDHTLTRSGAVTLVLLSLLGITSFPGLTRRLRVLEWRSLHRMVYLVWSGIAVHVVTAPRAPFLLVALTVLVTLLLLVQRVSTWAWSKLRA